MIPEEVHVIAVTMAKYYDGDEEEYKQFLDLAWEIYNKLQLCKCN